MEGEDSEEIMGHCMLVDPDDRACSDNGNSDKSDMKVMIVIVIT